MRKDLETHNKVEHERHYKLEDGEEGELIKDERGFHFIKSISIGNLFTIVSAAVIAIWWASTVETRIAINSARIESNRQIVELQAENYKLDKIEVRQQLTNMDNKLDRIIERQNNK